MKSFESQNKEAAARQKEREHRELVTEIEHSVDSFEVPHPDAYELFGGDDARYYLDEMPLYGTEEEGEDLRRALEIMKAFAATANADLEPSKRMMELNRLKRDYDFALFGIAES